MQAPEHEERETRLRAQLASVPRLNKLHQSFSKCIHTRLGRLQLGIPFRVRLAEGEIPASVVRDESHYRWLMTTFIRDPECESKKKGHCGNCMFHYAMTVVPVGGEDALVFVVERTVLTKQVKGTPGVVDNELFALTPEQILMEGRLANANDITSVHRHIHPLGEEQVS